MSTYPLTENKVYGSEIYFTKTYAGYVMLGSGTTNGYPRFYDIYTDSNILQRLYVVTSENYSIVRNLFEISNNVNMVSGNIRNVDISYNGYYRQALDSINGDFQLGVSRVSINHITKFQRSLQKIVNYNGGTLHDLQTKIYNNYYYMFRCQYITYTMTGSITINTEGYNAISHMGDKILYSLRKTSYTTNNTRQILYNATGNPPGDYNFADGYCEVQNIIINGAVYTVKDAISKSQLVLNGNFTSSDPIVAFTCPYYSARGANGNVYYGDYNSYYFINPHFVYTGTDYCRMSENILRNSMTYTNNVVEFKEYITTGTQTTTYDIIYG